jgi:hypothetical protein
MININKYLTIFIIFNAKIQRIFEKKEFLEKKRPNKPITAYWDINQSNEYICLIFKSEIIKFKSDI